MKEELYQTIEKICLDKKANDVIVFETPDSDLSPCHIICSGQTERQTQALADDVMRLAKEQHKVTPSAFEGKETGFWILLDYGCVIVHILLDEIRQYYNLEELWTERQAS